MVRPLLGAFVAGLISFFLVRVMFSEEEGTSSAVLSALIALLIIGWLGNYYYRRPETDLRQAGDNLYYLGLLFTLGSLIFALVQLFLLQQDDDELRRRTRELIGNFGIALTSTVAGILGRILLQSLSDETNDGQPGSQFEEVSPSVSDSVMTLRRKLRESTDAFSHFTRVTQSQAEQVKVHSERLISEFNARMSTEAERGLSEVMASWRKSLESIATESNQIGQRIEKEAAEATARTETAWHGLAKEMMAASESARGQLRSVVSETSALLTRLTDANQALNSLVDGLKAAGKGTRSLAASSSEATVRLDNLAGEIGRASETLATRTKESLQGLAQYKASVITFTESARDQLERDGARWMKSVTAITELAEARLQKATDDAEAVRTLGDAISKEADRSLAVVQQMRESLAEVSAAGEQRRSILIARASRRLDAIWNKMKRLTRRD